MNKIKIFLLTISLMFLASLAAIFISREFILHNKISDLSCLLNIWKDTYGWNFLINVIIALIIAAKFGKNDTKK